MSKFTPGPWASAARQGDDWDSVVYQQSDPNLEVCQCFHASRNLAATDRCEATTHLIAAAPEMYEALKVAKEFVENLQFPDAEWGRVLDYVVAALAKADGTQ